MACKHCNKDHNEEYEKESYIHKNHEHEIEHGHVDEHHHSGHHHDKDDGDEEEEGLPLSKIILAAVLFGLAIAIEKLPFFKIDGIICNGNNSIYTVVNVIFLALYAASYVIVGLPVIREVFESIAHKEIFNEEFLMTIATLGAIGMKEYSEAVAVMILFQLGEFLEDKAVDHSKKSIAELMNIRPDKASVKTGNEILELMAENVKAGMTIIVKPGERIPLDGTVLTGTSLVDTSALTGESVPREVAPGSQVISGCVNKTGLLEIKVEKEFGESTVSRILDLVENAQDKKTRSEKFITRFAKVYTPIVCIIAVAVAVIPAIITWGNYDWHKWVYRALELLVVSCPCALVISVPMSFMSGIGRASRNGILIKGSNYIEMLSKLNTVVFDKTGTLTEGVFEVSEICPAENSKYSKEEIVAFAAHAEYGSNHPISMSLKKAHSCEKCGSFSSEEMEEISGHGIKCTVEGKMILAGNAKLMLKENVFGYAECNNNGGTVVYVAVDGVYAGYLIISDRIKADAKEAVSLLHKNGVKKTVMLTGDAKPAALAAKEAIGIDEVYAELLPEDKVSKMEEFIALNAGTKKKVAFVGDGINDAPVLMRSDVGIAMGGLGSDAAIEASDVVIMDDMPSKVGKAVSVAKKTMANAYENIVFALGIKAAIIVLCILGIADMWVAVFGDVGVTMVAVLNSLRLLAGSSKRK